MGSERRTIKPTRREDKEVCIPARFTPRFWEHCDSRLAVVRSIRSRYQILRDACGASLSPQRDLLAQRIAFLATIIESSEVNAAEGGGIDLGVYIQGVNALTGLLKAVGLERAVKEAGNLTTYLAQKERKAG